MLNFNMSGKEAQWEAAKGLRLWLMGSGQLPWQVILFTSITRRPGSTTPQLQQLSNPAARWRAEASLEVLVRYSAGSPTSAHWQLL